jgi:hypothetical protein
LVRTVKCWMIIIVRMGDYEIVKVCYNLQVWNNENNMNWTAPLKHELDSHWLGIWARNWVSFGYTDIRGYER